MCEYRSIVRDDAGLMAIWLFFPLAYNDVSYETITTHRRTFLWTYQNALVLFVSFVSVRQAEAFVLKRKNDYGCICQDYELASLGHSERKSSSAYWDDDHSRSIENCLVTLIYHHCCFSRRNETIFTRRRRRVDKKIVLHRFVHYSSLITVLPPRSTNVRID